MSSQPNNPPARVVGGARVPEYRRQPSAEESANTQATNTVGGLLSAGISPNEVASASIATQMATAPAHPAPTIEDIAHNPKANPSTYAPAPVPRPANPYPNPKTTNGIQQPRRSNY